MDALTSAYDSGDEETAIKEPDNDETVSIDTDESSNILSRLKERFPLNSAPSVPVRVSQVCVY